MLAGHVNLLNIDFGFEYERTYGRDSFIVRRQRHWWSHYSPAAGYQKTTDRCFSCLFEQRACGQNLCKSHPSMPAKTNLYTLTHRQTHRKQPRKKSSTSRTKNDHAIRFMRYDFKTFCRCKIKCEWWFFDDSDAEIQLHSFFYEAFDMQPNSAAFQ